MWQCLKRGTTLAGRARALKFTYTLGPLAAVGGSLLAQFVLNHGIGLLSFPYDFAALYFVGALCISGVATAASQYRLTPVEPEDRPTFLGYVRDGIWQYLAVRTLALLWIAYLLWYISIGGISNLSLYSASIGRDPKELSGVSLALRFSFKAVGGFVLGGIAARFGMRAPIIVAVCLVGAAPIWAALAPGYSYLLAFGLMGAGELGGVYFPNYVVSFSSEADSARNLSILQLVTVASSVGPVLYEKHHSDYRISKQSGIRRPGSVARTRAGHPASSSQKQRASRMRYGSVQSSDRMRNSSSGRRSRPVGPWRRQRQFDNPNFRHDNPSA
jgi:hypothetical protein